MKTVLIVDPFSTGKLYAPIFNSLGVRCIAIISSPHLPDHFTSDLVPENFEEIFQWEESLLITLEDIPITAVIAGCETAIYLTDYLTELLDVKGNSRITSDFRRNKFSMQEALRNHHLPHINSRLLSSTSQIPGLLESIDPDLKYVIKPLNSAATEGVVFAEGIENVEAALTNAAWHQANDLGEINLGFIVQPFVSGPEYVVDMVAFDGTFIIASVCKYTKVHKNGSMFVYESLDTLDPGESSLKPLIDYAKLAAAALGIKVGPIHMEIIWSDAGPVMIEAGARLHGGIAPQLFEHVYQPDLLSLSVDCYLGRPAPEGMSAAKHVSHGKIGFFCSDKKHTFESPSDATLICATQDVAYGGHTYFIPPGGTTEVTIDFATCPGLFWLHHPNTEQLDSSAHNIRSLLWR
ncbi:ATP-grasp domain-containing protein [Pseudomonas sp. H11T01]|uniref:ATP-grasp domain-containing protein n=1 Tax=Pseudomonas sp. H11T01 TaxID=3402749 RepID=UPI003ABF5CF3